jgi:fatty acid desaturase
MNDIKPRSSLAVILLSVVTVGIYFYYWLYKVNQEAALIKGDRRAKPHVSLLAVSLGALLVIPFYRTLWTTAERVGYATGSSPGFAAKFLVCILLSPLAVVAYPAWVQGKLNGYVRDLEAQRRRAEMAGTVKVSVVRVQSDVQW